MAHQRMPGFMYHKTHVKGANNRTAIIGQAVTLVQRAAANHAPLLSMADFSVLQTVFQAKAGFNRRSKPWQITLMLQHFR